MRFQVPAHYRHLPCKCEYCTSSTRDSPVCTHPPSPCLHALKKPVWQASDWARPTAWACDRTLRRLQWKCVGGERRAKQRKAKREEGGVPWNAPLSLPLCFLSGSVMLQSWPPRLRFWRLCLPVVLPQMNSMNSSEDIKPPPGLQNLGNINYQSTSPGGISKHICSICGDRSSGNDTAKCVYTPVSHRHLWQTESMTKWILISSLLAGWSEHVFCWCML